MIMISYYTSKYMILHTYTNDSRFDSRSKIQAFGNVVTVIMKPCKPGLVYIAKCLLGNVKCF